MPAGKITVLRRMANHDLIEEYHHQTVAPCNLFEDGQKFLVQDWATCPEGFCEWAWIDIQKPLFSLATGGQLDPWMKDPNTWIACCTDGVKPVTFKLERILPDAE